MDPSGGFRRATVLSARFRGAIGAIIAATALKPYPAEMAVLHQSSSAQPVLVRLRRVAWCSKSSAILGSGHGAKAFGRAARGPNPKRPKLELWLSSHFDRFGVLPDDNEP
jgi:hypothetical protein